MKLFLFLFILQIVVISCATKQKETQSNPNLLVIDLDDIKTKETVKASDFFKNPKSIILETNEKSLIGNMQRMMNRITLVSLLKQSGADEQSIKQLNRILQGIKKPEADA